MFVIGSDGTIYKCTLAFNDDRNKLGFLNEKGEMNLDKNKVKLWDYGGIGVDEVNQCFYYPACQNENCPRLRLIGNYTPLEHAEI